MALALGAGLLSAVLITKYLARRPDKLVPVPMTAVAVAAADLPAAAPLSKESIELVQWPANALPEGSFHDAASLDGRITTAALVKGEPILAGRLAPKGARQGMGAVIPDNMRAMTVPVNEVVGVAGFIHPGDYVDVVTTMQTPVTAHSTEQEFRSKVVLQNIKVLAVGEDLMADESKPVKVPVVTLLVTPEESERLALASTQGKLQLTMRPQRDQAQVATSGISPHELLGSTPQVAAAVAAPTVTTHHHGHQTKPAPAVATTQPPPKKEAEVIEILRGDGFEERKMRSREGQ
jgi:pilus assembly protein CpaB